MLRNLNSILANPVRSKLLHSVELNKEKNKKGKENSVSFQNVFTKYFEIGYITHCYILLNFKTVIVIRLFCQYLSTKESWSNMESLFQFYFPIFGIKTTQVLYQ